MIDVQDPSLVKRFRSAGADPAAPALSKIPVFVNSYNRVTSLRQLIDWLLATGQRRIIVLDNLSTYPPLLDYYRELDADPRVIVVRLNANLGHHSLWTSKVLTKLNWRKPFVYTDPDILPDDACPADWLKHFTRLLDANPNIMKVGFGLRIDDLPDSYQFKSDVIAWEKQFWDIPVAHGAFLAPIDTTLALYRGEVSWSPSMLAIAKRSAIRTGSPYLARHHDWYIDSAHLTEEQTFYRGQAVPGITSWSLETLPDNVVQDVESARRGYRMIPLTPGR